MTTPSRQDIISKALEHYRKDNPHIENNPEENELLEGGYFFSAQHELMRQPYRQFEPIQKPKSPQRMSIYDFELDIPLLEKTNLLISGSNASGKTTLSCKICNILKTFDWSIIVFDNVGNWKTRSDLDYFVEVQPFANYPENILKENVVFDISNIHLNWQRATVNYILSLLWNTRTVNETQHLLVVLEESEIYCKNLRGAVNQEILRIMHSGRNRKIRVLAITTDLALLDTTFIRLCQQRFHGRIGIEENSRRKLKAYYGKECLETVENLSLGEFLYLHNTTLKVIRSEDYQPLTTPVNLIQPKVKRGFWSSLLGVN